MNKDTLNDVDSNKALLLEELESLKEKRSKIARSLSLLNQRIAEIESGITVGFTSFRGKILLLQMPSILLECLQQRDVTGKSLFAFVKDPSKKHIDTQYKVSCSSITHTVVDD